MENLEAEKTADVGRDAGRDALLEVAGTMSGNGTEGGTRQDRGSAAFVIAFVASCAASLLPLLSIPYPIRALWSPRALPAGVYLLVILVVALAGQLRLMLTRGAGPHLMLLAPAVLTTGLVLVHDLALLRLSDEMTVLVWVPALAVNIALAAKSVVSRPSAGSALALAAAAYLLSVCVRNLASWHSFQGMFFDEVV